jgi:hypothetical protein
MAAAAASWKLATPVCDLCGEPALPGGSLCPVCAEAVGRLAWLEQERSLLPPALPATSLSPAAAAAAGQAPAAARPDSNRFAYTICAVSLLIWVAAFVALLHWSASITTEGQLASLLWMVF